MAILNGKYRVKNSKNSYDIVYLETGASQVKFEDGKTFQEKLEDGTLKGAKGDKGDQGIQGDKGDTGITPTIKAGSVTTVSAGSSATVTASTVGTTTTFNFAIPQGIKGDTGAKGDKGDQGVKGDKGEDGLTTSITIGSTKYTHSNGNISIPAYPTLSSLGASASSHTHSQYENQNAFSSVKVGSTTVTADSPTDTIELKAGSNIILTPDSTNDAITIAVNGMTVTSSEKSSWNAKETTSGSQAKADAVLVSAKSYTDTKVGTKAEKSYVDTELSKKASTSHNHDSVYAKISHEHNSSQVTAMTGYSKSSTTSAITESDSLNSAIGKLEKALDGKQASGSYASSSHNHDSAYLSKTGTAVASNKLSTARKINGVSFDGTADITVADSTKVAPTGTIVANRIAVFNDTTGKVIKDSGFTIATSVPSGAKFTDTVYTHPSTHNASMITEDETHRFVSDTEKATWNAKASTATATQSANGLMSKTDKSKLDGIATNANNYVHPSSHDASMITQSSSYRFVTDTEKSNWNAKETTSGSQTKADKAKADAISSAKSYTDQKVAQFIDSAPETLDTLNELAKALGNDPNFATTVATQIGTKADTSYVNTELDKKANVSHGTHVTYSTTAPKANGTASAGTASTVARTDHVHPLQTSVSGNAGTATKLATARTISVTGDITGSASFDGSANASISTTLANSGVTSGSYGQSANATASFGGTFTVPQVTVDAKGRVISASNRTITMPSNPNSDTKVTNTLNTTTKAYVTGTTSSSTNTGTQIFDTGVYLDSTAGKLVATTFQGSLSGNASTASKLQTGRTITLKGNANGSVSFDGSGNVTINTSPIIFKGSGTSGTSGYVAFAQLVITGSYTNRPIEFKLISRGRQTASTVSMAFANIDGKDPSLSSLRYWGSDYGVFAHKTGTSTWLLYCTKSEAHDEITLVGNDCASQGVTITYPNTFITTKPTSDVTNATLGGSIGHSNTSNSATKATQDSAGQQINTTYIKGLSVSGKNITYTKGDGTTGTITTQDTNTTYSVGTASVLGLTKLYTGTGTATDGTMTQSAIKTALDGKASSSHTHSYLPLSGGTLGGNVTINTDSKIEWNRNSDYARISFKNTGDDDSDSYMYFLAGDNGNEYFKFSSISGSTTTDLLTIKTDHLRYKGNVVYHAGNKPTPSDIGASPSSHTHNYAGSSSAGGSANTAIKLATARTISLGGILKGSASFDGSGNVTISASANDITSITKSLKVTTDWMDTGISGTNLATGTYAVQMLVNDGENTSQWNEHYSGMMSWYADSTNSTEADEILLHKAGHAPNGRHTYLRTLRQSSGVLKLQISSTHNFSATSNIVFKFKKLI